MLRGIDTHAHLCDPTFADELPRVLERAAEAGVERVVAVAETVADARSNLELAAEFPDMVLPAAGLFPTILDLRAAEEMKDLVRRHAGELVAVGEVGLDLWKVQDEAGRAMQREILAGFIDLAIELDLPLNVHSRSAGRQTIDLLLERGATRVQMHAFDGRAAKALSGVEAGYFFSIPPSVVRSQQKRKLVARLPLECLLLETDSPVLGADPEERNEPAFVVRSLEAIAEIKRLSVEEVGECLWENTLRLYGARIAE